MPGTGSTSSPRSSGGCGRVVRLQLRRRRGPLPHRRAAPHGRRIGGHESADRRLVGSLIAPTVRRRIGTTATINLSIAIIAAASAGLALTTHGAVAAALMVANGVGVLLFNIVAVSLRQQLTPTRLQGRIAAVYRLVALGAMSIGSLAAGVLAAATSIPVVFWVSAAVVATSGVVLFSSRGDAPRTA